MATVLRSLLHFLMLLYVSNTLLGLAQDEDQFIYNGFNQAKLHLDGIAEIHPNGLLQLTDVSNNQVGHAFYQVPIKFNTASSLSFSTNFVFAMVPKFPTEGGLGIAFTISPSRNFTHSGENWYLGLFNASSNGLPANHILAIELDPSWNPQFGDIKENHVGIDVNGMKSNESAPAMYFSNKEVKSISLDLMSGNPMHLLDRL